MSTLSSSRGAALPRRAVDLTSAALLLATAATSQEPAFQFQGPADAAALGTSLAFCGDVDGDGYGDLLAGAPGYGDTGRAMVCSLADGSLIRAFDGVDPGGRFGSAVDGGADLDGDGVPEIISGAPLGGDAGQGRVCIFSGADGKVLFNVVGGKPGDELGAAVCFPGDLDGDGTDDFAAGAPGFDAAGSTDAGCVMVYSGATGAPLYSIVGAGRFGERLARVSDVDGDGVAELAVGAPAEDAGFGRVHLRSGASGAALWSHLGAGPSVGQGTAIAAVRDVDGDGVDEVATGMRDGGAGATGCVALLSGATGAALRVWFGAEAGEQLGAAVGDAGDLDGDGLPEVLIGSPGAGGNGRVTARRVSDGAVVWERAGEGGAFGSTLAGGADFHGGGFADVLAAAPAAAAGKGRVRTYTPRDLHLLADPTSPSAGAPVDLHYRGGAALAPAGLAVVGLDGSAVFALVDAGSLDVAGQRLRSVPTNPSLAGSTFELVAFSIDEPATGVQISNPVWVAFQ